LNNRFHFVSRWHLDAPVTDVYRVLTDLDEIARFWPGFRAAWTLNSGAVVGRAARFEIRSILPLSLSVTLRIVAVRPRAEIRAVAVGDLAGQATWRLEPRGSGTEARLTWDVRLEHPLLRPLAGPFRPLFRLSHDISMWFGERGLRERLAAITDGGRPRSGAGGRTA
jgi:uncharacterized protein YndB with AHSA1/START domain